MPVIWRVPIAVFFVLALTVLAFTQQERTRPSLQDWLAVPKNEAGLVLIVDAPVEKVTLSAEYPPNEYKPVEVFDWSLTQERRKLPAYARQRRVALSRMASKMGCKSCGELAMARSTSEMAVCCSMSSVTRSCGSEAVLSPWILSFMRSSSSA